MAGGYTIKIAGDASKLISSTKDAEDALETVATALDEIADESKNSATASAKNLDKIADAGKNAGKKIDKTLGKAFDTSSDKAQDSLDDVRKASKKLAQSIKEDAASISKRQSQAAKDTSEAWEEVGDEIRQNWGETASSFDGSAQSAVNMVSDTFGGLASSLKVGGLIGSAFLGVVSALVANFGTKWIESFDAVEERNKEMYQQMLNNANGYFNDEQIVENFNKILSGADDALIDKGTLDKYVTATKMSAQDIALAFADVRSEQSKALQKFLDAAAQENSKATAAMQNAQASERSNIAARYKTIDPSLLNLWRDHIELINGNTEAIKSNTAYLSEHGYGLEESGAAARDYAQAQADIASAFDEVKTQIAENIATHGNATEALDANMSALAEYSEQLQNVQSTAQVAGATTEEITALQYEQAAAFLDAAAAAGISAKDAATLAKEYGLLPDKIASDVGLIGADKAQQKAKDLKQEYDRLPKDAQLKVSVEGDYSNLSSIRQNIINRLGTVKIPVQGTTSRTEY